MSKAESPLIMTVDDDPNTLKFIKAILEGGGYRVITAEYGSTALRLLRDECPHLMYLDIFMPSPDGYETAEAIRNDPKIADIPIIFLSASGDKKDRVKALQVGGLDFLEKPINKDFLLNKTEKYLKEAEERRKLLAKNRFEQRPVQPTDYRKFKKYLFQKFHISEDRQKDFTGFHPEELYVLGERLGINEHTMAKSIAEFIGAEFDPTVNPENVALDVLPTSFCKSNSVVASKLDDGTQVFILSNPFQWELMEMLRGVSGKNKQPILQIADPKNISRIFRYSEKDSQRVTIVMGAKKEDGDGKLKDVDDETVSKEDVEQNPVIKLANNVLTEAVTQPASALHLEHKHDYISIRFRIDGDMQPIFSLDRKEGIMLITRFKVLAGMDIAEKRRPQDGAFQAIIEKRTFKFRVASTSTPIGESLIIRMLEQSAKPVSLTELGMTDHQQSVMETLSRRTQGLILMVGPTGSGKSTTIYSFLNKLDTDTHSLITVEDPVEYIIPNANQQQVNEKAGVTFENLLRSAVRQDPDVLFLGEIRDPYSAKVSLDFAATGHLIVSTLHTNNATTAFFRLERLGITRATVADTITAVVAQRLLKKLCVFCKIVEPPNETEIRRLSRYVDDVPQKVGRPQGCEKCHYTGYYGREGVYEIIMMDPKVAEMVRQNRPLDEIRSFARDRGDYLIDAHAMLKVRELIISAGDAYDQVLMEEPIRKKSPISTTPKLVSGSQEPKTSPAPSIPPAPPVAPKTQEPSPFDTSYNLQSVKAKKVLIVEDEPDIRAFLNVYLKGEGLEISMANDGIDALMSLGKENFDLILSDVNMPNMDGIGLIKILKEKGIDTPVIFLTARAEEDMELRALELGAVDYVKKPVNEKLLLARVKKALKKKS